MAAKVTRPCPQCGKRFKNVKGHQFQSHPDEREAQRREQAEAPRPRACPCEMCRSGRIPGMVLRKSPQDLPQKISYTRPYMEHDCEVPDCPHRANWKTFIPNASKDVTVNGVAYRIVADEENRVPGVVYDYYMWSLREGRDPIRPRQRGDRENTGNAKQLAGTGMVVWDTPIQEASEARE